MNILTVCYFVFSNFIYFFTVTNDVDNNFGTTALLILCLSSVLAFFYNVSHYLLINYTSAHYSVLIGNMKTVLLVFLSIYFFNTKFSTLNYFGLFLSIIGFCAYNYFKYLENLIVHNEKSEKELTKEVNKLLSLDEYHSDSSDSENYVNMYNLNK